MFTKKLEDRLKIIKADIDDINKKLKRYPSEGFYCTKNGSSYKWYIVSENKATYLPKRYKEKAQKLATKEYLQALLEEKEHEAKSIELYLEHQGLSHITSEELLYKNSEYTKLISPYFLPFSNKIRDWLDEPYERNESYPENLRFKTKLGFKVRSKSELFIVMQLHAHKIPFRYECALHLNGNTFFPDFTIMHPATGQIYYWEHFGLMDNPEYSKAAYKKLEEYAYNGIYPSINLITSYETKKRPLATDEIDAIIRHYFV